MAENEEAGAFLVWLATFELSRPVEKLSDLSDGSALFDVLSTMYVDIAPLAASWCCARVVRLC